MARHRKDRTLAVIAGSLLRRENEQSGQDPRQAPRHAAGRASGQSALSSQPMGQPGGQPVPLSGTCSCGRERHNVMIPGIVGDRWFRNVFTQCDCGEVMMLTIGQRPSQ